MALVVCSVVYWIEWFLQVSLLKKVIKVLQFCHLALARLRLLEISIGTFLQNFISITKKNQSPNPIWMMKEGRGGTTVQNRVFRISLKMARTCKKVGEWGFRVDFNSNPHKTKGADWRSAKRGLQHCVCPSPLENPKKTVLEFEQTEHNTTITTLIKLLLQTLRHGTPPKTVNCC